MGDVGVLNLLVRTHRAEATKILHKVAKTQRKSKEKIFLNYHVHNYFVFFLCALGGKKVDIFYP